MMSPDSVLAEHFQLEEVLPLEPRYNIAPSQSVAAIRLRVDSMNREMCMFRWGLIPFWAKDPGMGYKTINARAETVEKSPAYRAAFKKRRCLIPADGFYEWKKLKSGKQPYLIKLDNKTPFAMAGLWEHWTGPDDQEIESCTIITTRANEFLAGLHDRMPVIIAPEDYDLWLDTSVTEKDLLKPLLKPYPSDKIIYYPVSSRVNKPENDDPKCIEQVDQHPDADLDQGQLF
jgi:putative SOS response-associated peptidase YedK